MRKGDGLLFTDFPRVYPGARSIYGARPVMDHRLQPRAHLALSSQGQARAADAIVLPARGDKDMSTPSRYDQTIRFPAGRAFRLNGHVVGRNRDPGGPSARAFWARMPVPSPQPRLRSTRCPFAN